MEKGGLNILLHGNTDSTENTEAKKGETKKEKNRDNNSIVGVSSPEPEEQITTKIPGVYLNFVRDYQYTMIVETGNIKFAQKDAIIDMIKFFRDNWPVKILERPESVKQNEKKEK